MSDLIIDYVASGFAASFRLASPYEDYEKEIAAHLVHSSQFLKDSLSGHIKISGLFNAYTEDVFAKRVQESGTDFHKTFPDGMYADSGGLQVVTQGKTITPEQRKKIYGIQAEYADYAMSFDEIPAKMVHTKDSNDKIVKSERVYLKDIVGECGTKAGENLKEQIQFFDSIGANCKIVPIVQGIGLEDMTEYTLNMLEELDRTEIKHLECLAVGGLANEYELLERALNIYDIKGIPKGLKSHFHCLGVTGFRRLMPILIGAKNGLLPGLKKISFDSTTFTKSYLLGSVQMSLKDFQSGNKTPKSLGRVRNDFVDSYYNELFNWWKDNPDNIFEDAEDMIQHSSFHGQYNDENKKDLPEDERRTTGKQQYCELGLEHGVKTIVQKHAFVYYNTYKFMVILEAYLADKIELGVFLDGYKQLDLLLWLERITDKKEIPEFFESVYKSAKIKVKTVDDGAETTNCLF